MLYETGLYLFLDEAVGFFVSYSGGSYLLNREIFQELIGRYFPSEGMTAPDTPADMAERSMEYG